MLITLFVSQSYSEKLMIQPALEKLWSVIKMITVWQVPKKLSIELPYDSVIPPLPIYPKELKAGFRHLYTNAHSSSIHNGQKRKTIQMSTTVIWGTAFSTWISFRPSQQPSDLGLTFFFLFTGGLLSKRINCKRFTECFLFFVGECNFPFFYAHDAL